MKVKLNMLGSMKAIRKGDIRVTINGNTYQGVENFTYNITYDPSWGKVLVQVGITNGWYISPTIPKITFNGGTRTFGPEWSYGSGITKGIGILDSTNQSLAYFMNEEDTSYAEQNPDAEMVVDVIGTKYFKADESELLCENDIFVGSIISTDSNPTIQNGFSHNMLKNKYIFVEGDDQYLYRKLTVAQIGDTDIIREFTEDECKAEFHTSGGSIDPFGTSRMSLKGKRTLDHYTLKPTSQINKNVFLKSDKPLSILSVKTEESGEFEYKNPHMAGPNLYDVDLGLTKFMQKFSLGTINLTSNFTLHADGVQVPNNNVRLEPENYWTPDGSQTTLDVIFTGVEPGHILFINNSGELSHDLNGITYELSMHSGSYYDEFIDGIVDLQNAQEAIRVTNIAGIDTFRIKYKNKYYEKNEWFHIDESDLLGDEKIYLDIILTRPMANISNTTKKRKIVINDIQGLQTALDQIVASGVQLVNNLESDDADKALAAKQGKALKTLIDAVVQRVNGIDTLLQSSDTNLDTIQEIVDKIKSVDNVLGGVSAVMEQKKQEAIQAAQEALNQKADQLTMAINEAKQEAVTVAGITADQKIEAAKIELNAAIAGKANASHTHAIGDVTGLQSALDNITATLSDVNFKKASVQITGKTAEIVNEFVTSTTSVAGYVFAGEPVGEVDFFVEEGKVTISSSETENISVTVFLMK